MPRALLHTFLCLGLGTLAENRLWQVERWGWFWCRWIQRRSIWRRTLMLWTFLSLIAV